VFLGGISVYVQQILPWLRYLPKAAWRWLDQPWLIRALTKNAGTTSPKLLGALAVSMLEGMRGHQKAEFQQLIDWLACDIQPEVIVLSNLLIGGAIPAFQERIGARVYVTLQGDDIFLDALPAVYREQCIARMRALVPHCHGFLVHSVAYGRRMAQMLGIPESKLHVVPLAIRVADFAESREPRQAGTTAAAERSPSGPITLGYLARMAPEKGLHQLVDAFIALTRSGDNPRLHLKLAGWMGPQHHAFWEEQKGKLRSAGLDGRWEYAGSVDRAGKLAFLESIDLFCVPTTYADPKGLFLLEANAVGLPYVMPDHGAFPEVHARLEPYWPAHHGQLFQHDSIEDLVAKLRHSLARIPSRRAPSSELLKEMDIDMHAARILVVLQ
jgi:glycosyltransferase involved in cell wall biosynthesis